MILILLEYCKKVYKKTHVVETVDRRDTVCMRENPFYVDTVKAFRDRRYVYKTGMNDALKKLALLKAENADAAEVLE
jgi:DNA polymerase epsilon subunit 1